MSSTVLALNEKQTCRQAMDFLREQSIRRAPVLRERALVGMVSERDLLRVLPGTVMQKGTDAGADAERLAVARVMVTKVVTLDPEEHLEDAARKMLTHRIGGLPVVQRGEVVGILTESDIFRTLARVLESRGVMRVSFARTPRADLPPDPVRMALELGLEVRGYVTHDRPGGETLSVLRVVGSQGDALVDALGAAGFAVLEYVDARGGSRTRAA